MTVSNSILAFNNGGSAFYGGDAASFSCSDLFGNQGGDWVGTIAGQYGTNGNISLDPLFCNPAGGDFHLQENSPCRGHSPEDPDCDRQGAWPVGCGASEVADLSEATARDVSIVPNPASGPLHIAFRVASDGPVAVTIVDVSGRVVRTLLEGWKPSGDVAVPWDGRDNSGHELAAGVYLALVTRSGETVMGRIVLAH